MGHVYEQWWWIKEVSSKLPPVWDRFCRWCPSYNWGHRGSYPESQSHQVSFLVVFFSICYSQTLSLMNYIAYSALAKSLILIPVCFVSLIHKGDYVWKNVVFYFRSVKRRHCLHPDCFGPSHWHNILSRTMWVGAREMDWYGFSKQPKYNGRKNNNELLFNIFWR